ncbi:putative nuclease HARBI1 isoform X1 [Stomoxys calcitrans]|uniref:putative nuclease HARBI1 isoform X1 n=1 Tax=Stomoxys calcitrans TaxID=35570 RepID=UPI0027E348A6|nr:putative nuclease HARBI1 isoform X1 [Stomoxys calcitrans]
MYISVAVYFLKKKEEEIPRRHLRDTANVLEMPTNQFVANFRVSKDIFLMLLDTFQDKWSPMVRSTYIRPDIKLATFLRFLATGSYQSTVGNEIISSASKSSVCRIIRECLQLFENWICGKWIKTPTQEEEQDTMASFFEKTGFPGIIGCVDGTHVRFKGPGNDVKHLYYNRKGYYSINAMVICDHNMKIICVDGRHPGANHDAFIWEASTADLKLQNDFDRGKRNFWILGDGGYKLKPFLMTPYRNPRDLAETRYNRKHASARNVVERCFGLLKNRFRCIIGSRGLHYSPEKATQIINACCALHNMCITYKCIEEPTDPYINPDITMPNTEESVQEEDDRAICIRRNIAINL